MPLHDNRAARRLALAAIAALALHAVVASLLPNPRPAVNETVAPVTIARIERHPSPTPRPSAAPAPRTTPSAVAVVAQATRAPVPHRVDNAHPAPNRGSLRPFVRSVAHASPVPHMPAGGQGAGSGTLTGSGGDSGAGSGSTGGTGGGRNGGGGAQPCGFVTFSDPDGSRYDKSTGGFYVDIAMTVHFSNGSTSSLVLDYPWYYASESANPWSGRNRDDPNFPTTFQQPPIEKRDGEPPLVAYVMAHTTRDGYTLLKDCPSSPSPS